MNAQCNPFVVLFASAAGSQLTASKQYTTITQPCHNQGNNSQTQDATHSIYHRQARHTISGVITQQDNTNCLQLSITSYYGLEPAGVVSVYHEYDKTKVVSAFFYNNRVDLTPKTRTYLSGHTMDKRRQNDAMRPAYFSVPLSSIICRNKKDANAIVIATSRDDVKKCYCKVQLPQLACKISK